MPKALPLKLRTNLALVQRKVSIWNATFHWLIDLKSKVLPSSTFMLLQ